MKQVLTLIIFLLITTNTFADKKFEKDLKKISKDSAFIDNKGAIYSADKINNKENTILVIYTHGAMGDQKLDKCLSKWNLVPQIIRNLHNKKINDYEVKIYRLCSGVRGWSQSEQDKMWKHHKKTGNLSLKDSDDKLLMNKQVTENYLLNLSGFPLPLSKILELINIKLIKQVDLFSVFLRSFSKCNKFFAFTFELPSGESFPINN